MKKKTLTQLNSEIQNGISNRFYNFTYLANISSEDGTVWKSYTFPRGAGHRFYFLIGGHVVNSRENAGIVLIITYGSPHYPRLVKIGGPINMDYFRLVDNDYFTIEYKGWGLDMNIYRV